MVAVDPITLATILAEQRATRAAIERMERAILCGEPVLRPTAPVTPKPDRPVFRPAARTSAVTDDVMNAIAALDCWASAVDVLPVLTLRCTLNHLRQILDRLHARGVLDRRVGQAPARWEYRTRTQPK